MMMALYRGTFKKKYYLVLKRKFGSTQKKWSPTAINWNIFESNTSCIIQHKTSSTRATAFDFCKVKRGKDGGTLRTMTAEKLLKTLPALQAQVGPGERTY